MASSTAVDATFPAGEEGRDLVEEGAASTGTSASTEAFPADLAGPEGTTTTWPSPPKATYWTSCWLPWLPATIYWTCGEELMAMYCV